MRELVAEYSRRVEKSEDLFPLFKFWIELDDSSCSEVVVFAPVRSCFVFFVKFVLDGLVVFFNAKCARQEWDLLIKSTGSFTKSRLI